MVLKGILLICLIIISMFGMSGCGFQETADPGVPEAVVPNYPLNNKYGSVNYRFTVDSYGDETKETIITIEREH